ncbi:MAG: hypothetical protein ABI670_01115 [Chloroflexota bacterium]
MTIGGDTTQTNEPGEDNRKKAKRQRRSANWGGQREGAGRKPNEDPTLWMQVGVVLSPEEYACVKDPKLTPGQRMHRLLSEEGYLPEGYNDGSAEQKRKQYNVRVVLNDWSERTLILSLSTAVRRRRLLSVPVGGDIQDTRPGRWQREQESTPDE